MTMRKLQYIQPEVKMADLQPNEAVLLLSSATNNENFYNHAPRKDGTRAVF